MSCGSGCFREKCGCLQKMLPRGEVVARCRSGIRHRDQHRNNFTSPPKLAMCGVLNLSNSYSTGIPWSKRNRHKGSMNQIGSLIVFMLLLLFKSRQMGHLYRTKSFCEKAVFGSFPNFCCLERSSGLNRISHPDWVKLCVELSYAPNQNTKSPSATEIIILKIS